MYIRERNIKMGKETYYICDNCGLKLLLGMTQPSCGHRNLILDKYCSRTEQIIHILISVIDYKRTITCVAAKKRRSRNARAGIYNCHLAPFEKYAIAGIVWYQGESNNEVTEAMKYNEVFAALMTYMRGTHNLVNRDFPVFIMEFP